MKHFFNTVHEAGQILIDFEAKNIKGDDFVLSIFRENWNKELTPREVWSISLALGKKYELTSIRRSINTLTNNGHLVKLGKEKQKLESKGVSNYTWKLAA